jgi:hypothetical protein
VQVVAGVLLLGNFLAACQESPVTAGQDSTHLEESVAAANDSSLELAQNSFVRLGESQPPPSVGHALVYDDSLQAVLLVNAGLGGMNPAPPSTKTILWRWTGATWIVQDSLGPPIRNLGGVAYDRNRHVLVLYGGSYSQDLVYDETWEWGPSGQWGNRQVAGPGPRDHAEMAYDEASQRVILFGGQVTVDSFPADTWGWDGVAWQRLATTGPPSRVHYTMAFEPNIGRVMLFGGFHPPSSDLGDTWSWSGTAWEVAAPNIAPRTHSRMGFTSRGMILLGGFPETAASSILRLENGTWITDAVSGHPGLRYLSAMAFDPLRNVTVLFGGGDPASDALYSDTWEYHESTGWQVKAPAGHRISIGKEIKQQKR